MVALRIVLALTPREIDEFLPDPLPDAIAGLAAELHHVDVGSTARADWPQRLHELSPEVLVAGESTPPLPVDLPPALGYVCHLGGSVRGLVARSQLERGLLVTNWGGSVARVVAEGALALILAALRRTGAWALRLHRDGGWREAGDIVQSLFGRRVGIHGFGLTARELVRLLEPFGCTICSHAPGVDDDVLARQSVRRAESLEALFSGNDVVVELASLNGSTCGAVTEPLLRLIPDGGVFVNLARGEIVDEAGLTHVAREGRLQVALDVFAREPLPVDSPLRGLPNVTLSPHVSGPTNDRRRDAGEFALRNLRAYAEDRPLEAIVTPEIYDVAT